MFDIEPIQLTLLIICLICACAFEFVNGFHDTANAVATVIYTNTLRPWVAVVWSGLWNFTGVMVGGISVAMGIVNLLPVETLMDPNVFHNIGMILALLLSAIIWNLGTWYFGLPASSSHTLIGSILGIGISFHLMNSGASADAINWKKATEIGLSLLISPLFGFGMTIFLMYLLKRNVKNDVIFKEPDPKKKAPKWIRGVLVLTCTGVSFSHGSNDGQKGVGLVMLVLIAIVPSFFAINSKKKPSDYRDNIVMVDSLMNRVDSTLLTEKEMKMYKQVNRIVDDMRGDFIQYSSVDQIKDSLRFRFRSDILLMNKNISKLIKGGNLSLSANEIKVLETYIKGGKVKTAEGNEVKVSGLASMTDYAPRWVVVMISLSLGLGTMVGWKRIVKTIGEKIGKTHMTYAQGASAEMVAASTIGLASGLGLPVSTTHVLSSGIAGSMVANKGLKNLQPKTVKNILLAWVLTLPASILLSGSLYAFFRWLL